PRPTAGSMTVSAASAVRPAPSSPTRRGSTGGAAPPPPTRRPTARAAPTDPARASITSRAPTPPRATRCSQTPPKSPAPPTHPAPPDAARLPRAALVTSAGWVGDGVAPPPSRVPRIADGTAVSRAEALGPFSSIPGVRLPDEVTLPTVPRADGGAPSPYPA